MQRLSRDDIRKQFDAASSEQNTPFTNAVKALSAAINDMRNEGIDVELLLTGCATEQGFALSPGNNVATWRQKTSGILRIGNSQHLVAFCTQAKLKSEGEDAEWKDFTIMCVSKLDIRMQGLDKGVRTETFNLRKDGGLIEFQKFVINKAGVDAAISNADTYQSLSKSSQINLGLLSDSTLRAPKLSFKKSGQP